MERPKLTRREREIVRLVSLGCSTHEICTILDLTESTVSNHRYNAMQKLRTDKVALLTRLDMKYRFTPFDDKLTGEEKRLSGRRFDGWNY